MGIIIVILSMLYATAEYNSLMLAEYIVEQTLIQKAPPGTDPVKVHKRLEELLTTEPDRHARINLLFAFSGYLEKVQALSPQTLAELMRAENPEAFKMQPGN